MSQNTQTGIDKSSWAPGPWHREPDYAHWVDEATGLDCLIVRQPKMGHLCGYVGVPSGHPLFGADWEALELRAHGGVNFSGSCQGRICHVSERGEVWWLGFDCAHGGDCSPGSDAALAKSGWLGGSSGVYRDVGYVREQCAHLAAQVAAGALVPVPLAVPEVPRA